MQHFYKFQTIAALFFIKGMPTLDIFLVVTRTDDYKIGYFILNVLCQKHQIICCMWCILCVMKICHPFYFMKC